MRIEKPRVIRSKQEGNSRARGWMKQPHGDNSTRPHRAEAAKGKPPEVESGGLTGCVRPGIVRSATNRRCDYSMSHCPMHFCALSHLRKFRLGRRPRRDSLCGPAGAGPSEKPGRLAIDNRRPSTDKPGARKAGGADRRNGKPLIALANGPRHGFPIRISPLPDRVCPTARFPEKGRQRGRLVL